MIRTTPLSEPVDEPRHGLRNLIATIALAAAAWLLLTHVVFNKHHATHASDVRSAAGASSCQESGYQLLSHLDGSKTTIYDCGFPNGRERCVTMTDGVTRDATAEVRLLFAGTLGAEKPACLG
jgi:hypothetical protein